MKRQLKVASLLIGGLMFGSAPAMAAPDLSGTWQVTFYSEPNHSGGATQCIVFTPTGKILSEPKSGTWQSPSFSGWKGEWIQEGDYVRWYGFTTGNLASDAHTGLMVSSTSMRGEFETFVAPGKTSNSGAWSATKVSQCSTSQSQVNSTPSGDPTGK
ncbi:MAG TPA: hypothetical protein V6D14_00190 [Coleofasciculaceae cyanobacterium]|jgi:hypothetical protein